ncbi:MAG: hypothetical protein QG609_386 [Patescibacteria group bacterium]|nr:hypothetical protein [Patescibacteria group bacterium]
MLANPHLFLGIAEDYLEGLTDDQLLGLIICRDGVRELLAQAELQFPGIMKELDRRLSSRFRPDIDTSPLTEIEQAHHF